ncbi:MAG: RnfABCDGE type electron transport complex subunit D [Nitrospiria bacterium]
MPENVDEIKTPGIEQKPAPSQAKAKSTDKEMVLGIWPHVRTETNINRIMYSVIATLVPAAMAGIYLFGWSAIQVILISILVALLTEAAMQKAIKQKITITDGSAVLTALLLAMTLPPGSPWWMTALGSFFAIAIGKQIYGGLGYNPFNPALVGRVALLIGFPLQMTTWENIHPLLSGVDVTTGATPLGIVQVARLSHKPVPDAETHQFWNMLVGNTMGSLGETSDLLLLLGGLYLLYKHYITWHIPASMIGTVFAFSGIFWLIDPTHFANPLFHVLSGGLMLGAIFMATDMVTCPNTPKGQLVFGAGCGLLTIIIRMWGGYPEGVSFAILLMNSLTPMIDRYIQPHLYGAK